MERGDVGLVLVLENENRRWEIEPLDLEVGSWGCEEGKGVCGGIEEVFGAEDRMGILDVVEGSLEN